MLYILDAYNVLHKIKRFEALLDNHLRSAREALTAACSNLLQSRGDITSLILVFDGRSEFQDLPQNAPKGIRLVFSETGETADERITVLLEDLPKKPERCVVSDDNFVRNHARAYSARIMSVAEFEALLRIAENKNPAKSTPGGKASLPKTLADQITDEYRKSLGL